MDLTRLIADLREQSATFELLDRVGKGGMADVHRARDVSLRRMVAYKVMNAKTADKPDKVERFLVEAQITAQLEHPHIVPVYATDVSHGDAPAYTMKLVEGTTLHTRMAAAARCRHKGEPLAEALRLATLLEVFVKVCDAMSYAHHKAVIHRDLKPTNIMVGEHNEVYVVDWGIAKTIGNPDQTRALSIAMEPEAEDTHYVAGTANYMSPEQARGQSGLLGPESDQFTLGLILFEIVTGRRARPKLPHDALVSYAKDPPPLAVTPCHPSERIAPELAGIIQRATQPVPGQRYASVAALADDIRHFLANEEVSAAPDSARQSVERWLSRNREVALRVVVGLAAVVLLVLAGSMAKFVSDAVAFRERQERLSLVLGATSAGAAAIGEELANIEGHVQGIAAAARQLLVNGRPSDLPVAMTAEFQRRQTWPEGTTDAPAYGIPANLRIPDVFTMGPVTDIDLARLRTLAPVRHELAEAHLGPRMRVGITRLQAMTAWRTEPGPTTFSQLGLEDGTLLALPGTHWDTVSYDPRTRPWYELGRARGGPHWGNPYAESGTRRLSMPCSMGVRDEADHLLGVASVKTAFDWLIAEHMALQLDGVEETYLLSRAGEVMLRSSAGFTADTDEREDGLETPVFASKPVVQALATEPFGHHLAEGALYTWAEVGVGGWFFVVKSAAL